VQGRGERQLCRCEQRSALPSLLTCVKNGLDRDVSLRMIEIRTGQGTQGGRKPPNKQSWNPLSYATRLSANFVYLHTMPIGLCVAI
jgi:hypothetical protein